MKKNYIKQHRHDAEFEARIGKVIKEFSNEQETISIEEIESWVKMDNMKRRSKRKRVMSVAACFLLICGVSLSMRYYVYTDNPIAVAGGGDVSVSTEENAGVNEEIHTTWDAVLEASEKYPDMLVPGYIPDGYEFKELKVLGTAAGITYEYIFVDAGANPLSLKQRNSVEAIAITDYDAEVQGKRGTIYLKYDGDSVSAMCTRDKMNVNVQGEESKEHLVQIIDKLKSGS